MNTLRALSRPKYNGVDFITAWVCGTLLGTDHTIWFFIVLTLGACLSGFLQGFFKEKTYT